MRRYGLLPIWIAAALAATTGGCATGLGAPGGASLNGNQLADTLRAIATDTACGHTDRLNVILGPVPSGTIFLERSCPGPAAAPPPPPSS